MEWHTNRCSPSRVHRNRAVERHLYVPELRIHVSSATSSKSLQFLVRARNNLELARSTEHREELTEVILLQPQQAQRWIALGTRGSRYTKGLFGSE